MPRYNHAFDFAVEVISETSDGSDVTPAELRAALLERIQRLSEAELAEACGLYDSYEIPPSAPDAIPAF